MPGGRERQHKESENIKGWELWSTPRVDFYKKGALPLSPIVFRRE